MLHAWSAGNTWFWYRGDNISIVRFFRKRFNKIRFIDSYNFFENQQLIRSYCICTTVFFHLIFLCIFNNICNFQID
ncbi:unnamed protein product [Caenorhabditis angaria]|uniref:Uncharacterized protein n=1 Tax=Caenorhabditis angaria TaxID=860376 RepID=A0A9P1ILI0_9PELO|nr:unnamed protein product [Caenorhabditis angaria]